jgi:hypothetical protein
MITPLRQQYLEIKKQFPNTIVMFRLGDFYETFDDDAKIVSSVCNIVLTGRDMGTGNRVPLAGVPYHAVDSYLAKLIQAGHKVAIVEQTGNQQKVEGVPGRVLETREVVRVVTPGTLTDDALLERTRSNVLAAIVGAGTEHRHATGAGPPGSRAAGAEVVFEAPVHADDGARLAAVHDLAGAGLVGHVLDHVEVARADEARDEVARGLGVVEVEDGRLHVADVDGGDVTEDADLDDGRDEDHARHPPVTECLEELFPEHVPYALEHGCPYSSFFLNLRSASASMRAENTANRAASVPSISRPTPFR